MGFLFLVTCILWHFDRFKDIPKMCSIHVGYQCVDRSWPHSVFDFTSLYMMLSSANSQQLVFLHALACSWWRTGRRLVPVYFPVALHGRGQLLLQSISRLLLFRKHYVGQHQTLFWNPWWLDHTGFPLPLPEVTHQLVSSVVFHRKQLIK